MSTLSKELRRLAINTGGLHEACLGCGHEHNCGTRGCALIIGAASVIESQDACIAGLRHIIQSISEDGNKMVAQLKRSEVARSELAMMLAKAEQGKQNQ